MADGNNGVFVSNINKILYMWPIGTKWVGCRQMWNGSKFDFLLKKDYSSDFEILSENDILVFILSIGCIFGVSKAGFHVVWY